MALNVRNIINLSPITGTNNTTNWTYVPGPGAVAENTNPKFNRTVKLTATGLLISRGGNSVGLLMEDIMKAIVVANPSLTWVPNFANQPSNAYVGWGNHNAVSFPTVAQDELETDITYVWQFSNGTNVPASGIYSNTTTNTLNISNTATVIGQGYLVLVTNPSGSSSSNVAYVEYDPNIVTQPSNVAVIHPASASFTVISNGQTTQSFQWQYSNATNVAAAGVYSNVTTNTLNISNSTGLNGLAYRILVIDAAGTAISNNATLTVT